MTKGSKYHPSLLPPTTTTTTITDAAAAAAPTANSVGSRGGPTNASLLLADDALIVELRRNIRQIICGCNLGVRLHLTILPIWAELSEVNGSDRHLMVVPERDTSTDTAIFIIASLNNYLH
ncbi:unnamed protein product [Cercopithifilaria johnstoni]|uniref:Uncharacterized protein n=1 Tax=Cercopithifilaria johnstoni TaxID=2874296 RepID=A0A8J2Q4C5_9BILA|nr:unnamed protein product [Cercopithifilaria johnstoni]